MTNSDAVVGIPYEPKPHQIDEWSRSIYSNLRDWAASRQGKWEFWEPGYLSLTITSDNGTQVDPIILNTADEVLTVELGAWETHLPAEGSSSDDDDKIATAEARVLVEDWLAERLLTAIYFDKDGKWCGSLVIEPDQELWGLLRYGKQWIADFQPARIEVRRPREADWRHFNVKGEEIVEVPM